MFAGLTMFTHVPGAGATALDVEDGSEFSAGRHGYLREDDVAAI